MRKILNSVWTSATVLAMSVTPVLAQNIDLTPGEQLGPLERLTIAGLVSGLVRLAIIVAAVVFFFWLVLGGIRWIMSGGDKAKTEEARSQITAALVGLVIVFSAWAIAQLINALFNFDILDLKIVPITK